MRASGRYRIQAVSEMTGLPAATLRSWERRYRIPLPARTTSAYRLYSEDDVAMVVKLRDLCRSGIAPAQAARLVLASHETRPEASDLAVGPDPYLLAQARLLAAIERFDVEGLESELRALVLVGSASLVIDQVFLPVLRQVGERWQQGGLTVGEEHLWSEMMSGFARELLRLLQPASAANRVLMACFSDEEHVLPLLIVALHFAQWGYRTVLLGARTPPDAVAEGVLRVDPSLVALSVTMPPEAPRGAELVDAYARACGQVPWIVGGAGLAPIREAVLARGGLVAEEDLPSVPGLLAAAVKDRRAGPSVSPSNRAAAASGTPGSRGDR